MARKVSKMSLSYKGSSSKTLSTHTIGYKDDFKIRTRDDQNNITSVYEFVYSTSLDLVTSEKIKTELYSKFIKIYPKYVIVNHLETPLKYRQYQNQSDMKILEPNERQILFWPNDQFPQLLSIKALDTRENVDNSDDNTKWNWTQGTKNWYLIEICLFYYEICYKYYFSSSSYSIKNSKKILLCRIKSF